MKYLVLPSLLLALAGSAHAGIATTFHVNSAVHSVVWGQGLDPETFTPFGGTLRSSLKPDFCRNRYKADWHNSVCQFDLDTSDFYSPYDSMYIARMGRTSSDDIAGLIVDLHVQNNGYYWGSFTFAINDDVFTDDANGSYNIGFLTNYSFQFHGTGMNWDTAINATTTETMWNRSPVSEGVFSTQWTRHSFNPKTGEYKAIDFEDWNGSFTVSAVPEPSAPALFGIGLAAFAGLRRRKRC